MKPSVVKIKFVGLFDSVSSFDATGEETPATPTDTSYILKANRHRLANDGDREFLNDVSELHLTMDDPALGKVVHLLAADEYRLNFSATTIASALKQGTGFELRLPGAHSDIGGGYAQQLPEVRKYGTGGVWRSTFDFFRNLGWYGPGQFTQEFESSGDDVGAGSSYIVGQRILPNTYQYVALGIMLKLAGLAQSGLQFSSPNQDEQRNIKCFLAPGTRLFTIKNQLESFAIANYSKAQLLTPLLATEDYCWLRQHYLHLSWSNRTGFEFRRDEKGLPTRKIITG